MQKQKLQEFQKELRTSQTIPERILWRHLRNRSFNDTKFRRQHILHGYIVDFVCIEKKLVIELDGSQHNAQVKYDNVRTQKLQSYGYSVLRFWNNDVLLHINSVLEVILIHLQSNRGSFSSYPHPNSEKALPSLN